jgi:hypothetical protein
MPKSSLVVYLTTLFDARKGGGCCALHTSLPDTFGPGPLGPQQCSSWSLCLPWCRLHALRVHVPLTSLAACWSCCHGGPWDKNHVSGEAVLTVEGSVAVFCQPALGRLELGVETPAQCWREYSAYCAVLMVRISPSWRYNLSTALVECAGSMSRSVATAAMFWLALAMVGIGPLTAGSGARLLGLSSGGGEVHC